MTATDATLAGLLRAILERPDDDLPRLVYADRLEELGRFDSECPNCDGRGEVRYCDAAGDMDDEPCKECGGSLAGGYKRGTGRVGNSNAERAEFIRVQCELALFERCCDDPDCGIQTPRGTNIDDFRRREKALLVPDWFEWSGGSYLGSDAIYCRNLLLTSERVLPRPSILFRRGFVESVSMTLAAFAGGPCPACAHPRPDCPRCKGDPDYRAEGVAPRLFASQPVTRVTLTDRGPEEHYPPGDNPPNYSWYVEGFEDDAATLPAALFGLLTGWAPSLTGGTTRRVYPTRTTALSALSQACVAWGRTQAGLTGGTP